MRAELNGAELNSLREIHDQLSAQLRLPSWYGRNPDALLDCLTDLRAEDTEIVITDLAALLERTGSEMLPVLQALHCAEADNPRLTVTVKL